MAYGNDYDSVRRDQAREGRQMAHTEGNNPQRRKTDRVVKKKPELKGHEAFLKHLEESGKTQGTQVEVEKMSGEKVIGIVRCSDHYTITLRVAAPDTHLIDGKPAEFIDRVIFKHDISEFRALQGKTRDAAND